jgi:hypothetical protein
LAWSNVGQRGRRGVQDRACREGLRRAMGYRAQERRTEEKMEQALTEGLVGEKAMDGCEKKLGTALIETWKRRVGGEVMGNGARRERVYEQKK